MGQPERDIEQEIIDAVKPQMSTGKFKYDDEAIRDVIKITRATIRRTSGA